ncbi:MAG: hypothetical protein EOO93_07745 [Pedobacter sp.]|nr:MAG: hypothetical protein EOO93_07745 [Pedobacter sp.]
MIEVFRTDVTCPIKALEIVDIICIHLPALEANFDLEDCDHVFRISTENNDFDLLEFVAKQFEMMGHFAIPLEDKPLLIISSRALLPIHEKQGINAFLSFI